MLSKTLEHYKDNYSKRLFCYLKEYVDNTELIFLENELNNCIKTSGTLKAYKTNSKPSIYKKAGYSIDISFLKSSGFNLDKVDNHIATINGIMHFIQDELDSLAPIEEESIDKTAKIESANTSKNQYPQIFLNEKAFQLFEKLYEHYKSSKNRIADFSFVYRIMEEDGYIINSFKPQMFIRWISNPPYVIDLDKIKTMPNCSTDSKKQLYKSTKELLEIE